MNHSQEHYEETLKATATAFRLGMEGQASHNLVELIDLLSPIIADPCFPDRLEVNELLGKLLDAQTRKDYHRAADLLEYEIALYITPFYARNLESKRRILK